LTKMIFIESPLKSLMISTLLDSVNPPFKPFLKTKRAYSNLSLNQWKRPTAMRNSLCKSLPRRDMPKRMTCTLDNYLEWNLHRKTISCELIDLLSLLGRPRI
jgi:hypothetical protein